MLEGWVLSFFLMTAPDGPLLIRFPMTSETACNTARTGMKFYPPTGTVTTPTLFVDNSVLVWCATASEPVTVPVPKVAP